MSVEAFFKQRAVNVMVAGRWVVKNRHHAAELPVQSRFCELMKRLPVC